MRIAVTGGTGAAGRYAVEAARAAGHEAVVLSRAAGVDIQSGTGLRAALEGAEVIIDASNPDSNDEQHATSFFVDANRNLQQFGVDAGVRHLVTLSIVGIDRVPVGYYAAKLAHERQASAGPLPATILRATQFHEFPAQIVSRNRVGASASIPNHQVQTVAARTVGEHLVELAVAPPAVAAQTLELGGPEAADLLDLATSFVAAHGWDVAVEGFDPGVPPGSRLPSPGAWLAGPRFDEWLTGADAARIASSL